METNVLALYVVRGGAMILTGGALYETAENALTPAPDPDAFGPVSVDVRVDIDGTGIIVESGDHLVAPALEEMDMPDDKAALLTGRSTHMRQGMFMPAGWVDPGYSGVLKLEFGNTSDGAAYLEDGEAAARLIFFELRRETDGYDGQYGDD